MAVRTWTLCLVLGLFASPGWAYEEISVTNGGTISGQVTITGQTRGPWPSIW